ncbi:hypothetical protein C7S18_04340 [Ahniella affigens]|uniref:Protein kinase domain-containing protein n=1 Tax=Ahniella affigens TaxID=2021234 RepID=A0A2P1PNQ3_9GAMM|nr:serine/threonine-protein kinase [Ahniella affigens]AVP96470.1 hypothetical protein C7S18_04340 [Ahniella affigens]
MSFDKIKQLFDELASLPPKSRTERLAQADIGEQTRGALRRLLDLDDAMAGDPERVLPVRDEPIPERIGPFTIDGLMGEGGMGRVFRAHREVSGVRQAIAIKVIRRDRLDAATRARFQLERQVLAVLKHPHIASMVDVGETIDGQPYLALEYIDGQHITQYAAEKQLGLRARIQLFRDVASAVAYAHRNLIVHRDLKPSNVLVDADGMAKVIDFGIAKPLMSQFGESEVGETQTAQRFFSPQSAAPEQLQGGLVTPSCDIYGLGALLYELLAGTPVFDFTGMNGLGIEKAILTQEPVAPSARIAVDAVAGMASDADLDAIALVCLRKNPEDRYSSVEKLIEDLDAWLDSRPVAARNGNSWYRFRRFVTRHRRSLAFAASLFVVMLVAGGLTFNAYRNSAAQTVRADQFAKMLIGAISSADPGRKSGVDLTARELFRSLVRTVQEAPDVAPNDRQDLQLTLTDILLRVGDSEAARKLLEATPVPTVGDSEHYFKYFTMKATLLRNEGKFDEAGLVYGDMLRNTTGNNHVGALLSQLRLRYERGEDAGLIPLLEQLKDPPLPNEYEVSRLGLIADIYRITGQYAPAQEQYEAAIALAEHVYPEGPAMQSRFRTHLLWLTSVQGDIESAERYLEAERIALETYHEPGSLPMLLYMGKAAQLLRRKGKPEEALALQREHLALLSGRVPADSPILINETFDLAQAEFEVGNRDAAMTYYEKVINQADRIHDVANPNRMLFRAAYCMQLASLGRWSSVATWIEPAVQNAEKEPSLKKWDVYPIVLAMKAGGTFGQNKTPENRRKFVEALKHAREGAESPETIGAVETLIAAVKSEGIDLGPREVSESAESEAKTP